MPTVLAVLMLTAMLVFGAASEAASAVGGPRSTPLAGKARADGQAPGRVSEGSETAVAGQVFYAASENRLRAAVYFAPDGTLMGFRTNRPGWRSDSGIWWTTPDRRLCWRWTRWDARVRCVPAAQAGAVLARLMGGAARGLTWAADPRGRAGRAGDFPADALLPVPAQQVVWLPGVPGRAGELDGANADTQKPATHPFALTYTSANPARRWGRDAVMARLLGSGLTRGEELAGYLASALVLLTFCMREMLALRCVAILSNLAFMTYGYLAVLPPVFFLHVILLPINAVRLRQLLKNQPLHTKNSTHPNGLNAGFLGQPGGWV